MLRGAIFDLDGTLGNTLPVCYRAFRRVFGRRLGRDYTDAEIHAMFGPSEEGIVRSLCTQDPEGALEEFLAEYRAAHRLCPRPFEGLPEAINELQRRGVELAIVTGKGPRSARISLEIFGLEHAFPVVEAGSPDGGVKPAAMRRVLDAWGLRPEAVVGIGDSPSDIRAAKGVGAISAAAAWASSADRERLAASGPDHVFEETGALRRWLESVAPPLK